MRVLIDTNIILDVVLDRKKFLKHSAAILKMCRDGRFRGFVAATTLTNIHYLVRKAVGSTEAALLAVNRTLEWCEVAPVNYRVLDAARSSGMPDFEDAVQTAAAKEYNIDTVVTRDTEGFTGSGLQVYLPEEFCDILK